jgi:small subunit ribosomal protein S12
MPTFNQLVRKGREQATYKSASPAMQKGLNTIKNCETDLSSPKSAVFAPQSVPQRPKSPLRAP